MTTYTIKEISELFNLTPKAIYLRFKKHNIEPIKKKGSNAFFYTNFDIDIIDKRNVQKQIEVIYVTQTFLILPSKMNYD